MFLRRTLALIALLLPLTFLQAADSAVLHKDDIEFVKKATVAGMLEVRSAEAALTRNLTAEEQTFTRQIISDHRKANEELAAIAKRKGVTPPSELSTDELEKLSKISEVKDKDFNEEFLEHQISCHKKAVDLFEDEADDGHDVELKAFAAKTLPALKTHLETAKRLEAKY